MGLSAQPRWDSTNHGEPRVHAARKLSWTSRQAQVTCILSSAHYKTLLTCLEQNNISGCLQSYSKHLGVRANPTVFLHPVVSVQLWEWPQADPWERFLIQPVCCGTLEFVFALSFFSTFWVQVDADLWLGTLQVQTSSPPSCGFCARNPAGSNAMGIDLILKENKAEQSW